MVTKYCKSDTILVAHSHGGQVAALALAEGLPQVKRLVTIGTPVREDMREVYKAARGGLVSWHHFYSNSDWMQLFGSLFDGSWKLTRAMDFAQNVLCYKKGHSAMLKPSYWEENDLWELVLS